MRSAKIPTREETVAYADLIYDLTRGLLRSLHETAGGFVGEVLEAQIQDHGQRAADEDREYVPFSFEGMFGLARFAPEAIATADAEYATRKADPDPEVAGSDFEYLKTDLGFEEALRARKRILELSFHRGQGR